MSTQIIEQTVTSRTPDVLAEIAAERGRQDVKWGEQNHPNGTGPDATCYVASATHSKNFAALAGIAKRRTDAMASFDRVTFADILIEEVFEALAEDDQSNLRTELIQVAAVAAQWVEAIDRAENRA